MALPVSLRNTSSRLGRLTVPVSAVTLSRPSLDDVFLKLTGKAIRDEGAGEMDQMRMMVSRWSRAGGRR